jgi:hypothetical protein
VESPRVLAIPWNKFEDDMGERGGVPTTWHINSPLYTVWFIMSLKPKDAEIYLLIVLSMFILRTSEVLQNLYTITNFCHFGNNSEFQGNRFSLP